MFRLLFLSFLAAAVLSPSASAMHAPGDHASVKPRVSQPSSMTADQRDARLGPKYVSVRSKPAAVRETVASTWSHGFGRWLIPAAALLLLAVVVSLRRRRSAASETAGGGVRAPGL